MPIIYIFGKIINMNIIIDIISIVKTIKMEFLSITILPTIVTNNHKFFSQCVMLKLECQKHLQAFCSIAHYTQTFYIIILTVQQNNFQICIQLNF